MKLAGWVPLILAILSSLSMAYDISLPLWNINYTAEEVAQQRAAGLNLLNELKEAKKYDSTSYVIPAGIYRIGNALAIEGTSNLTIVAKNVEIISEFQGTTFSLIGNTNISIQGPLYLDADPFGTTQAVITGTDNRTYIDVRKMPGYPDPTSAKVGRLHFFTPNGTMLPTLQYTPTLVTLIGPDLFRLVLPDLFWNEYTSNRIQNVRTGNLIDIELDYPQGDGSFSFSLRSNKGVSLSQIAVYHNSLLYSQYEAGKIYIDQYYGVRRPGTNRLGAGGWPLVNLQGGSWHMLNSELSYNFDDLTDIQSGVFFAYNQTSPTQVYMPFIDGRQLSTGDTLHFYNLQSYAGDGSARVAGIEPVYDPWIGQGFNDALDNVGLRNMSTNMTKVTLDRPVQMTSFIDFVDIEEYRSAYIIFENCYMHDGLAAGIAGKGSQQYIVRNCSVARVPGGGITTSVDPYWAEGAVASNVLIQGNTVEKCPYGDVGFSPSIATTTTTSGVLLSQVNSTTFNNVTISNNTILDSPGPGISLQFARNVAVTGNTIIRPMSGVADNQNKVSRPIDSASAIYLDVVGGVVDISGNLVIGVDVQNTPKVIRAGNGTDSSIVGLCANAFSPQTSQDSIQRLPNELWTAVLTNSSMVTTTQPLATKSFETEGARHEVDNTGTYSVNTTSQKSSTTFRFMGTGVQFLTCVGPQHGLARVYLDGQVVKDVDASVTPQNVVPDPVTGFCDQLLYSATGLPNSLHNLTVASLAQPGVQSMNGATDITISSFAYLMGLNQCSSGSPTMPEALLSTAVNKWENYKATGVVGPNVSTVSFAGSAIDTRSQTQLASAVPLAVAPVPASTLAPAPPGGALPPPPNQSGPPVPPLYSGPPPSMAVVAG